MVTFPALALAAAGCSQAPAATEAPPPKVTVQHPVEREVVDYDRYNGWTRASEMVEVRARVRGHIDRIHFTDGEYVEKKALLFELDPRPFQAEIDRASDQLAIDEAQLEFANAEADRNQQLFDRKTIAKAELEKTIATRKTWEARVQSDKAEIKRRQLDLEYSRVTADIAGRVGRALLTEGNLVNAGGSDPLLTTIVSIDPIYVYFSVDERTLLKYRQEHESARSKARPDPVPADAVPEEGQPKEESTNEAAPGTQPPDAAPTENGAEPEAKKDPAAADAPKSEVEAKRAAGEPPADAAAPAKRRNNVVKDAKIPFEFGFETETGYPHKGVIDFADNRIDPDTGTIELRGTAPNADGEYFPGARVRVRVPISEEKRAILVPDTAILSDQDLRYVLVLNDKNVVVRRNVALGKLMDDGLRAIIPAAAKSEKSDKADTSSGISASDWIIVLGLQRARINYPVEPLDADGKPIDRTAK